MNMKNILKYIILFMVGACTYFGIEVVFRGFSHWSMWVLGGLCFISIGLINELFSWETPFYLQCIIGAIIVTSLELLTGYIVNIWLDWNVWNYSHLPCSFFNGQINLFFSMIWCVLSAVAIVVDDWLRHWLFKEEKPHYKFI